MRIDAERKKDKVKLVVVADNAGNSEPGRLVEALRAGRRDDLADVWAGQVAKLTAGAKEARLELDDPAEIRSFADCIRNVWNVPTREIHAALAGLA
jgi:hypothetical protein